MMEIVEGHSTLTASHAAAALRLYFLLRSNPSIFKSWVRVSDLEDAPQLVLFKSGKDVCLGCQSNAFKCCTTHNVIVTSEEFPVVFGPPLSTYAIMTAGPLDMKRCSF